MAEASPISDAPEAPGAERARGKDQRVLGRGNHAQVTLKRAILHVYDGLKSGFLPLPKMKTKLPKGMAAKTALVVGVSSSLLVSCLSCLSRMLSFPECSSPKW